MLNFNPKQSVISFKAPTVIPQLIAYTIATINTTTRTFTNPFNSYTSLSFLLIGTIGFEPTTNWI